ncbi:hypothetical protein K2173_022801 [Erythroxylum novogranatense]|uniref:E2F/DP family winged-helix DNA-binding domain-containing protein n=1 Tax=Erythroxylum novogranatense TaxID=1862640 RepID=A0AAV8SNE4_9ROSI|nr:hypothetical protein K2173_022801 [Erythroxylum novogranatense]
MLLSGGSQAPEPSSSHQAYRRKEKSLCLLCTNFLNLYNRDGTEVIGIDEASSKLGVERRRIYDIVNVLEIVGVLARKAKNQYTWKGYGGIPKALKELKEESQRKKLSDFKKQDKISAKVSDDKEEDNDDEGDSDSKPNSGSQNKSSIPNGNSKLTAASRFDGRKEKSLGHLTQNFVRLFLCYDVDLISLQDAANVLLGDAQTSSTMRRKARRLYDIANVLSSVKLIEKTYTSDTRKPAVRWLGLRGKSEKESRRVLPFNNLRKRTFGTDVANICFKRNKVETSTKVYKNLNQKRRSQIKAMDISTSGNYQYGPFAPITVLKVDDPGNKVNRVSTGERRASTCRPEYLNQALRDLFVHYMEAWKSWCTAVAERKPIHIS